jgi:hypothetical protein
LIPGAAAADPLSLRRREQAPIEGDELVRIDMERGRAIDCVEPSHLAGGDLGRGAEQRSPATPRCGARLSAWPRLTK